MGKFRGSTEKVEYRCTTTNFPPCNDTIIIFKITPLHSISVITNFVIPKRDKQTKKTRNQYASPPRGDAIPAGPLSDFLKAIFTKLGMGRVSQVRSLTSNFTVVGFKMWAYGYQNRRNW